MAQIVRLFQRNDYDGDCSKLWVPRWFYLRDQLTNYVSKHVKKVCGRIRPSELLVSDHVEDSVPSDVSCIAGHVNIYSDRKEYNTAVKNIDGKQKTGAVAKEDICFFAEEIFDFQGPRVRRLDHNELSRIARNPSRRPQYNFTDARIFIDDEVQFARPFCFPPNLGRSSELRQCRDISR